jgi:hypothetical protein
LEFDNKTMAHLASERSERTKIQGMIIRYSGTSTYYYLVRKTIAAKISEGPPSTLAHAQFSRMESDYQESKVSVDQVPSLSSNDEILKMLTAISSQMVIGQQDLQNQLIRNDLKLQNELQRVMEENEKFKHEIRAELQGTSFQAATVDPTSNHFSATSSSSLPPVVSSAPLSGRSSSSSVPTDFQTQMLAVLNNTFSQLSTVISNTSSILLDAKSAMTESVFRIQV